MSMMEAINSEQVQCPARRIPGIEEISAKKLLEKRAVAMYKRTGSCRIRAPPSRTNQLARKLHAHSVMYANKLITTRLAIENKNTSCSQFMEPGASNNPPGPH
eukprot:1142531-Pelagomonas_calceolata.AAC.1